MTATLPHPSEIKEAPIAAAPPRHAFTITVPTDCLQLALPQQLPSFHNPAAFVSVAVFVAAYGSFVFTVATRPASSERSLREALFDLCREKGFEIERAAPVAVDCGLAAGCIATQKTATGLMKMRILLLEDDGRIFCLTGCSPAPLWRAHSVGFYQMFESFKLAEKFGQTLQVA